MSTPQTAHEGRDPRSSRAWRFATSASASPSRPSTDSSPSTSKKTLAPVASDMDMKVVIVGYQGVGKTSLVKRYTLGNFDPTVSSTIGAGFVKKNLDVNGVRVRLQLWDTAGQERFRSMAPLYYRGAKAALIVYDVTNEPSFYAVKSWFNELTQHLGSDVVIQFVAAKCDLDSHRKISHDFSVLMLSRWMYEQSLRPEIKVLPRDTPAATKGSSHISAASASYLSSSPASYLSALSSSASDDSLLSDVNPEASTFLENLSITSTSLANSSLLSNFRNRQEPMINTTAFVQISLSNARGHHCNLPSGTATLEQHSTARDSVSRSTEDTLQTRRRSQSLTPGVDHRKSASFQAPTSLACLSEVSAKTDQGIDELFIYVASQVIAKFGQHEPPSGHQAPSLDLSPSPPAASRCC